MEEFRELIRKAQAGDKAARDYLTEKNLGLVHSIVRRFEGRGCEREDLFQIGCVGLLRAIDRFDLSLGLCFSTYAVPMITGEIKRFLRDDGPVKISRTIRENKYRIAKATESLQEKLHRAPTLEELGNECRLSKEELVLAMEAGERMESLQELSEERYLRAGEGEKDKVLNRIMLEQLMENLEENERKLLIYRYFENKTQTQVAGLMGSSQVQICRAEKKLLRRLREQIH